MRNLLILPLVCLLATQAFAQEPTRHPDTPDTTNCFAGTVWFNTAGIDTIFLCYGDSILVEHNGDQVFGPPVPGLLQGIRYIVYQCQPTGDSSYQAMLNDTCLWPGSIPGYWATFGPADGNHWIRNTSLFHSVLFGNGSTFANTFAPAIFNDFASQELEPGCVHVNTDAAFTVVFLSEIRRSNFQYDPTDPCLGTIRLRGGVAEWDTSATYTLTITLAGDTSMHAVIHTLPGEMKHGAYVSFTVPQPGLYFVAASDATGCANYFEIDMSPCKPTTSTHTEAGQGAPLVSIIPSPAHTGSPVALYLQVEQAATIWVSVFGPDGQSFFQQNSLLPAGKTQINIPTNRLRAGVYTVLIQHESGTTTQRFVLME